MIAIHGNATVYMTLITTGVIVVIMACFCGIEAVRWLLRKGHERHKRKRLKQWTRNNAA